MLGKFFSHCLSGDPMTPVLCSQVGYCIVWLFEIAGCRWMGVSKVGVGRREEVDRGCAGAVLQSGDAGAGLLPYRHLDEGPVTTWEGLNAACPKPYTKKARARCVCVCV